MYEQPKPLGPLGSVTGRLGLSYMISALQLPLRLQLLTFTHRLQPGPGPIEQTGALRRAPQQVAHLTGEAQEALRLKLIAQPRPMGRGPWVSTEPRAISY